MTTKKIGGIRFIKIGALTASYSIPRHALPSAAERSALIYAAAFACAGILSGLAAIIAA